MKKDTININVGDAVTINGTVARIDYGYTLNNRNELVPTRLLSVLVALASGDEVLLLNASDINTIHSYKEPSGEDNRKGN